MRNERLWPQTDSWQLGVLMYVAIWDFFRLEQVALLSRSIFYSYTLGQEILEMKLKILPDDEFFGHLLKQIFVPMEQRYNTSEILAHHFIKPIRDSRKKEKNKKQRKLHKIRKANELLS